MQATLLISNYKSKELSFYKYFIKQLVIPYRLKLEKLLRCHKTQGSKLLKAHKEYQLSSISEASKD